MNTAPQAPDTPDPAHAGTGSSGAPAAVREDVTRLSGSHADRPAGVAPAPADRPLIEGYELLEEAHRGGQGIVYRAMQLSTKRTVAVKVLLDGPFAGDMARRRFEREIELAASLRHPNIVTILDSGVSFGRYYFAMEFIDGRPLDQHLAATKLTLHHVLELLERICLAVNFAHLRGVIHRDLKPSNILIDADGSPQVLDFGLAKSRNVADPQQTTVRALSTPGQVMGTLAYMSPEQAAGQDDVDVRSDVYSLGVIAYEALLGRTPYPVVGSLAEVLNRIARDDPAPPRSVRSSSRFGKLIGEELETILLKALEKDPARRYQTAGELAADLRRYLNGDPIEAKRASGLYVLRKTLKRYRIQATAAALILATILVSLVVFAVLYQRENLARAQADGLRHLADERAESAAKAAAEAEAARADAQFSARQALLAAEQRRDALVRQRIHRGDAAQLSGDLAEARDSYWDAYADDPGNAAALWSLRHYYVRSGDRGAAQLFLTRSGPLALSPGGAVAAVCEAPGSVAVRSTSDGRTLNWVAVPGGAKALDVDDQGNVAVAGDGWALVRVADAARPAVVLEWPDVERLASCHVADGGEHLFAVGEQSVRCFRVRDRALVAEVQLGGELTGRAEYSPDARQLAVPTGAGVELLTLNSDGSVGEELFWQAAPGDAPRAVRFVGDELLAVLADSLSLGFLTGDQRGRWTTFLPSTSGWDAFDLKRGVSRIVLGTRDGRVAEYNGTSLEYAWRITSGRLEHLRLAADAQTIVTIDDQGSVTRWDPESREERRQFVHAGALHSWWTADDGSALLLIDRSGQPLIFVAGEDARAVPLALPGIVERVTGRDPARMLGAVNRAGGQAVIHYDGILWFASADAPRATGVRWTNPRTPDVRGLALSGDGRLLAVYSQSVRGDVQQIQVFANELRRAGRRAIRPVGPALDFAGSTVRAMQFLPGTYTLLAARSNGALVLQDARPDADAPRDPPERGQLEAPLTSLDSPAYRIAIDRAGHALAAACDDGIIRLVALVDGSELGRIALGRTVGSLSFNAAGDGLLVRTTEGDLRLYPLDELDAIPIGPVRNTPRGFAAWTGERDALLYEDDTGVYEIRYQDSDRLIEENRTYALQRRIAHAADDGAYERAWEETRRLAQRDARDARGAQVAILEELLRRFNAAVNDDWIREALADAPPLDRLRLGHAAYAGGRFELAAELLRPAAAELGGPPSGYTAWRLAECEYLLGDAGRAADELTEIIGRGEVLAREHPRIHLERIAALSLAERAGEARSLLSRLQTDLATHPPSDPTAPLATLAVGGYLVGNQRDAQLGETFERLLTVFKERWLLYRDDSEFFIGETARRQGNLELAQRQYQKCIDLARDAWPADWAALRLRQLREGK